jgi:phage N-6-adenine-methyltransferase
MSNPITVDSEWGFYRDRDAYYSNKTVEWATPTAVFARLDSIFHFDLDVCATPENAKCAKFYTKADDGLAQNWTGTVWCNPPYGRGIGEWVRKAVEASEAGATVVMLLPARTNTVWWHAYATRGDVTFLCRGLRFNDGDVRAPFGSAIVVFSCDTSGKKRHIRQCTECEGIFATSRAHASTCGPACRTARWRAAATDIAGKVAA